MHELSIAQSIISITQEEMRKRNAKECLEIHLQVGETSGIEVESLEFVLSALLKSNNYTKCGLKIETTPSRWLCILCEEEFIAKNRNRECPKCGMRSMNNMGGTELLVKSITME